MVRLPRFLVFAVAITMAVLVQVGAAGAAPGQPGGSRPYGGFGMNPTMMLGTPSVQNELQLVDDQKAQIKTIGDELQKQMSGLWGGLQGLPREQQEAKIAEIQAKTQELTKAASEKLNKVLLPTQQKRLAQIALQMRMSMFPGSGGPTSLVDNEDLAASIGLTADQLQRLKAIRDRVRQKLQELPKQIIAEGEKEAKEVLTAEQQKKLEEALGAKFEFQLPQRPPTIQGGKMLE